MFFFFSFCLRCQYFVVYQVGDLGCVKVIDDVDFFEFGLFDVGLFFKKFNKFLLVLIFQLIRELVVQVKDYLQVVVVYIDITVCLVFYIDVFF